MSALAFNNVTINLGQRKVLAHTSFSVENGEFIGVLGANGAGKTTLMRAALGLIPVQSGSITVQDHPIRRGNKTIGYMPQNRGLGAGTRIRGYDMIVSAALGGGFGFKRLDQALRREIDWALDQVGALELARRSIGELSGGERQRLLLSQALLGHPRLLLLDEPLISLDPAYQKAVVESVKRLRDELKLAILFSAHELNPLLNAIDRVLYLGSGKALIGSVDEVVTGPILSDLYNADIDVVRLNGRIFVMAGDVDIEADAHRHDDHDHHHSHEHGGN